MELTYLSPSQVTAFLRCSVQWHLRWVEKAGGAFRPSITFSRGKALDKAVQWYLIGDNKAAVDDVVKVALNNFAQEIAAPDVDNDMPVDEARAQTEAMVRSYLEAFSDIRTRDIQRPIAWVIDGVAVKGYVDLIQGKTVWDLKGYGDSSREQHPPNRDVQLMTYAAALQADHVGWLIVYPDGKASRVEADVKPADIERTVSLYATVIDSIRQERFVPADPSSWVCTPKFCPVWNACRWGGKQ